MVREDVRPASTPASSTPLVTIVSTVYNQERYVARCVESALSQTYPFWEQIVVDDGSTDRTREIVASYGDSRIRTVALPHRGLRALGASYNAALTAARGSLVGILEGDDEWPPHKLAHQVPLFEDPGTMLTWGRAALVDDEGRPVGQRSTMRAGSRTASLTLSEAFHRLTRTNFLVPSVTVMVRRDALDAVGGFQQAGSELFVDLGTWLHVAALVEGRAVFLDEVLGVYRLHARQASQRERAQMAREHWQVLQHVESAVGSTTLARIGWNATARRRASSGAMIAEGDMALLERDHGAALSAYRAAFSLGALRADRLRALIGMASALTRVDVASALRALRALRARLGR